MRTIRLTFAFVIALAALPFAARAADSFSIHAVLITATNLKREADPRLKAYEADLQRNIPLSSFRYVTEGSASVPAGGQTTLSLSGGHRLVMHGEKGAGRSFQVRVQWLSGREAMLNTTLTLSPGGTGVLMRRPPGDQDTPIILVIAK